MDINTLIELCDNAGIEYQSYSGRGMYGERCFAAVTANNPATLMLDIVREAVASLDTEALELLLDLLENPKCDTLGLDSVVYWPKLKFDGSQDEND